MYGTRRESRHSSVHNEGCLLRHIGGAVGNVLELEYTWTRRSAWRPRGHRRKTWKQTSVLSDGWGHWKRKHGQGCDREHLPKASIHTSRLVGAIKESFGRQTRGLRSASLRTYHCDFSSWSLIRRSLVAHDVERHFRTLTQGSLVKVKMLARYFATFPN